MIKIGLQIALALIEIFVRRSERKRRMQKDMMDLARKHSEEVTNNARLRRKYSDIVRELAMERKESKTKTVS